MKSITPTFVVELPLRVNDQQNRFLTQAFEFGRTLYNATLGSALGRLQRMRESLPWRQTRSMPKGKERSKRFSDLQSGIFSLTGSQFKTAKRFTDDLLKNPENEDFIIPSFFLYVTGAYLSRETEKNKLPELLDSFVEQLKNIIQRLAKIEGVIAVERSGK